MIGLPLYTKAEKIRLDRRSNENMLLYYEREMHLIAGGEKAASLMSRSTMKHFMGMGILDYSTRKGQRRVILTRKGHDLYGINSNEL